MESRKINFKLLSWWTISFNALLKIRYPILKKAIGVFKGVSPFISYDTRKICIILLFYLILTTAQQFDVPPPPSTYSAFSVVKIVVCVLYVYKQSRLKFMSINQRFNFNIWLTYLLPNQRNIPTRYCNCISTKLNV